MIKISDDPTANYRFRVTVEHLRNYPDINEIHGWTNQTFIPNNWYRTGGRWGYTTFHFKHEADRIWFVLRWS